MYTMHQHVFASSNLLRVSYSLDAARYRHQAMVKDDLMYIVGGSGCVFFSSACAIVGSKLCLSFG